MPRLVEVSLVLVILLISLPVALLIAALVAADLGRPVMFRQTRAGRGGRVITVHKFRTMRDLRGPDARPLLDAQRVTPLGRRLRRTRLDEIPQLLAVLRGELALVGPRPLLPATVAGFGPDGRRRGQVRPGMTGWAQVNGNTRLEDDEKLALDLWYVAHRRTALDLWILWLTACTLVCGETREETRIGAARDWRAGGAGALAGLPQMEGR